MIDVSENYKHTSVGWYSWAIARFERTFSDWYANLNREENGCSEYRDSYLNDGTTMWRRAGCIRVVVSDGDTAVCSDITE